MGLYTRGKYYYYRKQVNKKEYRVSLGVVKGQERLLSEAIQKAEEKIYALVTGAPTIPSDILFRDYADRYLQAHAHKKSYNDDVTQINYMLFVIGNKPVCSITIDDARKLEKYLLQKKRTPATINRYMTLLKHILTHAVEDRVISENPLKKWEFYVEERKREALTQDEIARILEACAQIQKSPRSQLQAQIYNLVVIAFQTGMRLSELLNLKWSDIKGDVIELPVTRTKYRRKTIKATRPQPRQIPLNEIAIQHLPPQKDEYVFSAGSRTPDAIRRTVKRIRKLSGVHHFEFHQIRHTVATLIATSVDVATAKEVLGHASISTTLRYTHPTLQKKREAVTKVGTLLIPEQTK